MRNREIVIHVRLPEISRKRWLVALGILCFGSAVYAAAVTYSFSAGQTLSASKVNTNFSDLTTAVTTLENAGYVASSCTGCVTDTMVGSGVTGSKISGNLTNANLATSRLTGTVDLAQIAQPAGAKSVSFGTLTPADPAAITSLASLTIAVPGPGVVLFVGSLPSNSFETHTLNTTDVLECGLSSSTSVVGDLAYGRFGIPNTWPTTSTSYTIQFPMSLMATVTATSVGQMVTAYLNCRRASGDGSHYSVQLGRIDAIFLPKTY